VKSIFISYAFLIVSSFAFDFEAYNLYDGVHYYENYQYYYTCFDNKFKIENVFDKQLSTAIVLSKKNNWFWISTVNSSSVRTTPEGKLIISEYNINGIPKKVAFAVGYWKSKSLFFKNSRVKNMKYIILQGEGGFAKNGISLNGLTNIFSTNLQFQDEMKIHTFEIPNIKLKNIFSEDSDKFLFHFFSVTDVYLGNKYPDDICISEINFLSQENEWYSWYGIPMCLTNE